MTDGCNNFYKGVFVVVFMEEEPPGDGRFNFSFRRRVYGRCITPGTFDANGECDACISRGENALAVLDAETCYVSSCPNLALQSSRDNVVAAIRAEVQRLQACNGSRSNDSDLENKRRGLHLLDPQLYCYKGDSSNA